MNRSDEGLTLETVTAEFQFTFFHMPLENILNQIGVHV